MKQHITVKFSLLCGLIVLAAFSRMLPHPLNFAPLSAMALFGAAYFDRKALALAIPLVATWLSDLFLNNVIYAAYYPKFTWFYEGLLWSYGAYALIGLMGMVMLKRITLIRCLGAALSASAIFFLISNFSCWIGNPVYPQNFSGLLACLAAGLPFLQGTVAGDLVYVSAMFGTYEWMKSKVPALQYAAL